MFVLVRKE